MWEEISDLHINEDGQQYKSYGITNGSCSINDITVDSAMIQILIERFNRNDVSTIHAFELVEDFIVEMYS